MEGDREKCIDLQIISDIRENDNTFKEVLGGGGGGDKFFFSLELY